MEEGGERGGREGVARDKDKRKEDDRKRKSDAKVSFLRQYYPDAHSSRVGSMRIRKHTHKKQIRSR